MKKQMLITVIFLFILAGASVCHAAEQTPAFTVDDISVAFDDFTGYPYISDTGRTMLPLRACLSAIGCQVDWDQSTQTVSTSKDGLSVKAVIGSTVLKAGDREILLDSPAVIKNGRTFLPLRALLTAYGYGVDWDNDTKTVNAVTLTAANVNGGSTGIFSRRQLGFEGFDGIEADITLPVVTLGEKGDCPYVYFGFDWPGDAGNAEGGFQFIEDPAHEAYGKWIVFLRQGNDWQWESPITVLEPGFSHHLKFYSKAAGGGAADLIIQLDGREVIRKSSAAGDFSNASAKAVISMAMSKKFDGANCYSRSEGAKIENLQVSPFGLEEYLPFSAFAEYSVWNSARGMQYGTAECVPSYLHYEQDGSLSIYK